ncbi:uncharacterized protein TRIADDRAFT_57137 [Trichoplax adhaerens]|uniref:Small ribosomal subunit protein uS10m n=1 Tax=Trichoplax adhaerens TaxID=10228 RepID=B3S0Q6_TRIAD|nr:hypothetical protein TRIADDRAFT_57137 [Trichoplax adhaerens]EDV23686.1 hypothetical protein TRIADDRAFT_57137 [Trichoplax adhaerens]|eukprot:XP_002113212.1 hypothetical protein TRIADDRAFT_57137 [Trichoplax adhaerens]
MATMWRSFRNQIAVYRILADNIWSTNKLVAVNQHRFMGNTTSLQPKQAKKAIDDGNQVLYGEISIKILGNDFAVLDSYAKFLRMAANNLKIKISGRVDLPAKIQKFTVLKSPHIFKKHRTQYEVRTHSRILKVRNLTAKTADIYLEYIQRNIPEGVAMTVFEVICASQ